jgi:hypothetical protein
VFAFSVFEGEQKSDINERQRNNAHSQTKLDMVNI